MSSLCSLVCHSVYIRLSVCSFILNLNKKVHRRNIIRSFIFLCFVIGYNIHIPTVKTLEARLMQRTMPSSAFLMPSPKFWNKSEVLIQTPHKNYTVNDYKEFYTDLNFTNGYLMMRDTENLVDPFDPPHVAVHCLYSYGLKTTEKLVYTDDQWPDKKPTLVPGDGDETVSIRSLEGCLSWNRRQKQPFYSQKFRGITHSQTMKNDYVIKNIQSILMKYS